MNGLPDALAVGTMLELGGIVEDVAAGRACTTEKRKGEMDIIDRILIVLIFKKDSILTFKEYLLDN